MTKGREMPIFRLNSKITVSAYTEVAAESLDDAMRHRAFDAHGFKKTLI